MRFLDWEFYQHAGVLGPGLVWEGGTLSDVSSIELRGLALALPAQIPLFALTDEPLPPRCVLVDTSATAWQLHDLPAGSSVYALPRSYGNPTDLHTHAARVDECVSSILSGGVPSSVMVMGLCSGAITAFDVAIELQQLGHDVSKVVLVSPAPRELDHARPRSDALSNWAGPDGEKALVEMYGVARSRSLLSDWVTFDLYRAQILEYGDRSASVLSSGWSSDGMDVTFGVDVVLCDDTPKQGWWTSLRGEVRVMTVACRQCEVYRREELRRLLAETSEATESLVSGGTVSAPSSAVISAASGGRDSGQLAHSATLDS